MKKTKTAIPEETAAEEAVNAAEETADAANAPVAAPDAEPENAPDEDRVREDVTLFHTLFPDVNAKDVPQEVWDKVEAGESLAASFALYTLMQERESERIRRVNAENAASAPPRIRHDGTDGVYFSPEAVKSMSR